MTTFDHETVDKLLSESPSNRLSYICVSYALVFLFTFFY